MLLIKILDATHRPIQHIGKMAGVCYGSNVDNELKNYKRGIDCIESDHNRTFEYVDVTMEIDGYSNRVIRELYTHVIGVTRLQQSTRYIDMSKRFEEYYIPKSIKDNPDTLEAYEDTMWVIQNAYEFLLEHGIPKEDAGNLVPLGQHTKIVLKANLEAIFHFFSSRTCTRVLPEFRALMNEMRLALMDIDIEWELICKDYCVTKCVTLGFCPEKKSCGRYPNKIDLKGVKEIGVYPTPPLSPTITPFAPDYFNNQPLKLTGIDEMVGKIVCDALVSGLDRANISTSTTINTMYDVEDVAKQLTEMAKINIRKFNTDGTSLNGIRVTDAE